MANPTMTLSSSMAAETCTPLQENSSRRPSRSPFISPPFMATAKSYSLATHPPSPASVNTAARPLIPNSHVSESHNSSHARDVPPSNAPYEPFSPPQIAPTYRTATSMSSWVPESHQTILSTATSTVSETQQSTCTTPIWITGATGVQPTVSTFSTTSMGLTTSAGGAAASATNEVPNPLQGASSSSTDHA